MEMTADGEQQRGRWDDRGPPSMLKGTLPSRPTTTESPAGWLAACAAPDRDLRMQLTHALPARPGTFSPRSWPGPPLVQSQ